MHHTRSPRRRVIAGCLAVVLAASACGGGGDSEDAGRSDRDRSDDTDETDDTDASAAAEPVETAPSTVPVTTAPVVTSSAEPTTTTTAADTGDEPWSMIMVRQVTADQGYWGIAPGAPLPVEARRYELSCVDDECDEVEVRSDVLNPDGTEPLPSFVAGLRNGDLVGTTTDVYPCVSTATGAYDGPALTAEAIDFSLSSQSSDAGDLWGFAGTFSRWSSNPGSPECEPEDAGYTSDAWLFDPASTPRALPSGGVYLGESTAMGVEKGLRACTPADGPCDMVLRQVIEDHVADGQVARMTLEWPLVGSPEEGWTGSINRVGSCVSDLDDSFVTAEGYDFTHEVTVTAFDAGGQEVLMTSEVRKGTPLSSLPPEQLAVCAPFEHAALFAGLPTSTPTVVDWNVPVGVAEVVPTG